MPLTVEVTAGQVHDSMRFESVIEEIAIPQRLGRPRKRPKLLAGDKGYSAVVCETGSAGAASRLYFLTRTTST